MLYFSRLKTGLILLVCLLGILFCLPNIFPKAPFRDIPWNKVELGLDLRGGSYLLMQVDMNAVIKQRLAGIEGSVRENLIGSGIFYTAIGSDIAQHRVYVRLRDPLQLNAAMQALSPLVSVSGDTLPDLTLTSAPGGIIFVTLKQSAIDRRAHAAVAQSIQIIGRRIDGLGVSNPQISSQGFDRVVIQLPGVSDPGHIKKLLGETAHMTFHLLAQGVNPQTDPLPPPGVEYVPMSNDPKQKLALLSQVAVNGDDLTNAEASQDPQSGQWVVNFTFNSVGSEAFAKITEENIGKPFAIVIDHQIISAPVIREAIIGGRGQISGGFNATGASDLALLLRAGALPAPLTVVEQQTVGPELGAEAIKAGTISLIVGFFLVVIFMAAMYGFFGWIANIALVFNLVFMLAALSVLHATLTLPGMAGILLTLGMAVDANILINERIREEVRSGRPPLAALEGGFKHAYGTIIDSNVATFLAHIMLFVFGSGPVRGFAITIMIGILTSLFTSTVLARLITVHWYMRRRPAVLPV